MKLVLGSTSVYRKMLLQRLRIPFESAAPNVDETPMEAEPATDLVRRLAHAKAHAVAQHYPDALVIGSDQVAALGEEIMGKPGGFNAAVAQLTHTSGKRVEFLTGLCLINTRTGNMQNDVVAFTVAFRQLTAAQIDYYVRIERPYNCAGAIKVEGLGVALFESMHGADPTALMGLPLIRLVSMLEQERFGVLAQHAG